MNPIEIARKLRELRGSKSLEYVANAVGITKSSLCNYECGIRVPRDEIKVKLANFYGVSVQYLFF